MIYSNIWRLIFLYSLTHFCKYWNVLCNLKNYSSKPYFSNIKFDCSPCAIPKTEVDFTEGNKIEKCIHPGQLLFHWSNYNGEEYIENCKVPTVRSKFFSYDNISQMAFSKVRKCFNRQKFWTIKFNYKCGLNWNRSKIKFIFKKKKRWLQRRNSKKSPIHFRQSQYMVKIAEDAPVHSQVIVVEAVHELDSLLYYSLSIPQDSRSQNFFELNTITGEISVAKPLDRETLSKHVLKITAYERLDPSASASAIVIVDLLDVQDNAPQFERSSYFAEIREDAPIGTTVINVFARDFDEGVNSDVNYRLEDLTDMTEMEIKYDDITKKKHYQYLSINSKSGVIQTIKPLDREKMALIRARVVAFDHGIPQMYNTASVEVSVIDINDNAPRFVEFLDLNDKKIDECFIKVPENVSTPLKVLTVRAEDPDFDLNGKVHYSIVSSIMPNFVIDYISGIVTMRERLTLRQSPLSLLIRAKDSGQPANSVTVQCPVTVFDVNDHSPRFISALNGESIHEILVDENVPIGYELGRIYAIDEDFGYNGEIHYFLQGNVILKSVNKTVPVKDIFTLNETSGSLITRHNLDREVQDSYQFLILARDNGIPPLESLLDVIVIVKDLNDNAPKFQKDLYELELFENITRGSEIFRLKATDADLDQKLTYKIEFSNRNLFAIVNLGEQGAILSLTEEFTNIDEYVLITVSATDQGGLRDKCNISINVRDINSAPYFIDNSYAIRIPENSQPGFHVYKINAVDDDRGQNSKLIFSIDSEYFEIDATSGLIVVRKDLDREKRAVHTINITVSDNGDLPLNASTTLEVILDDVNDNPPIFTQDEYHTSISEDTPIGTSFFQLNAVDADEGSNGIVDFFFDEQNNHDYINKFRLDHTSGILRVNSAIDRETTDCFILSVIAQDRGDPSLSARTTVNINIEDVNDNAPKFEHGVYDFWVEENSPPGTVVGTIVAIDPDLDSNSRINFKIFGGNDAKFFEIESEIDRKSPATARIITRTEFDFEALTNKFFIEVQANSEQLSSIVPVIVHISDINDNVPRLKDFTILVPHYEFGNTNLANLAIGSVPASDPDFNATLEYFIEPNELISIDKLGVLSFRQIWSYSIHTSLQICVSDGPNIVCAQCQIIYMPLTDAHLDNSLSMELIGLRYEDFLNFGIFNQFVEAIAALHDSWLPENVGIFSVQKFHSTNDDNILPSINVSLFVVHDDSIVSSWRIEEILTIGQIALTNALSAVRIHITENDMCVNEPCPYFQRCRQTHKYIHSEHEIIETDSFLMHSISTIRSFKCECPQGFTTNDTLPGTCNKRLDLCFTKPCINNGTCVPLENTYRCECPPERTGKNCEFLSDNDVCMPFYCHSGAKCKIKSTISKNNHSIEIYKTKHVCDKCKWTQPDTDTYCRLRTISFSGEGYINVPLALSRLEWTLRLTFATASRSGTILFAGTNMYNDHLQIALSKGLIYVEISIGANIFNDTISLQMSDVFENRVDDGEWHIVNLEFYDKKLRIWLDNCDPEVSLRLSEQGDDSRKCAVEKTFTHSSKCDDLSAPCNRFFDVPAMIAIGGRPLDRRLYFNKYNYQNNSLSDVIDGGFIGCIKDVYLNEELVHFSNFDQFEQIGKGIAPGCRKYRPDICSYEKPCIELQSFPSNITTKNNIQCVDKWLGHLCKCPNVIHSTKKCHANAIDEQGLTDNAITFMEDSYVIWHMPNSFEFPFELKLEFRTHEKDIQMISLEFDAPSQYLLLSLENGYISITLHSDKYFSYFPYLANGIWHSIYVRLMSNSFHFTIDYLYTNNIDLSSSTHLLSAPRGLYTGVAPSSSHPHLFIGCIRNFVMSERIITIEQQLRTRLGCIVQDACILAANKCLKTSECHLNWDQHKCKCNRGFAGDRCIDVCSIKKICGSKGTCVRTAFNNDTYSYDCICENGRRGRNCQRELISQFCPKGWFGEFPNCHRCNCAKERGFLEACNIKTGECKCRPGTYLRHSDIDTTGKHANCIPCECGYGTRNGTFCDPITGQCNCIGEATGRRCDRCTKDSDNFYYKDHDLYFEENEENRNVIRQQTARHITKKLFYLSDDADLAQELVPNTLKCAVIKGHCAARMEFGIQWPTTRKGTTVQHSCTDNQLGIMTRFCSNDGRWSKIYTDNCTLSQLADLKVNNNVDLIKVTRTLVNLTRYAINIPYSSPRNINILIDIVHRILSTKQLFETLKDHLFLQNILIIASHIIEHYIYDPQRIVNQKQFNLLLNVLNEFGVKTTEVYRKTPYLKPFWFSNDHFVFVIDRFTDNPEHKLILKKNNNFIIKRINLDLQFELELPRFASNESLVQNMDGAVFYLTIVDARERSNFQRASPIFAIHAIIWQRVDIDYKAPTLMSKNVDELKSNNSNKKELSTTSNDITNFVNVNGPVTIKFNPTNKRMMRQECMRLQSKQSDVDSKEYEWVKAKDASFTNINETYISCHYNYISLTRLFNGIFALSINVDKAKLLDFSLAPGETFIFALCVALMLLICGAAFCMAILRRGIFARPLRCVIIFIFVLNASTFMFLQGTSSMKMICSFRDPIITIVMIILFTWLFIYSFHIYRILIVGTLKICLFFSLLLGIVLPILMGSISYWTYKGTCEKRISTTMLHSNFWLLLIGVLLLCIFSFYALVTALIMVLYSKQYHYAFTKYSIRALIFAHSLLIILCAIHNAAFFISFMQYNHTNLELRNFGNLLIIIIAVYLLLWVNFPYNEIQIQNDSGEKSAQTMWVDNKIVTAAVTTTDAKTTAENSIVKNQKFTPVIKRTQDGRIYEGVPNEWIPDAIASETYIHHTLERSIQTPLLSSSPLSIRTISRQRERLLNENANVSPTHHNTKSAYYDNTLKGQYQTHSSNHQRHYTSSQQYYYQSAKSDISATDPNYNHCIPSYHHYNTMSSPRRSTRANSTCAYSTLSRRPYNDSNYANYDTHSNNIASSSPLKRPDRDISGSTMLKFSATTDDEMNDAYYTYTLKRSTRAPATTFNG